MHKAKSFNSGIAPVLAKVRSPRVKLAKVGARPGKPKDSELGPPFKVTERRF